MSMTVRQSSSVMPATAASFCRPEFATSTSMRPKAETVSSNTSDRTTLRGFLDRIEKTYGKAKRMWVMDRGIPTEEILQEMRDPAREIFYLVGTPKGKIQQYEKKWLDLSWQKVRESVEVKLFEQEGELYVLAKSAGRQAKETAMRRKRLTCLFRKLRAMRRSL